MANGKRLSHCRIIPGQVDDDRRRSCLREIWSQTALYGGGTAYMGRQPHHPANEQYIRFANYVKRKSRRGHNRPGDKNASTPSIRAGT